MVCEKKSLLNEKAIIILSQLNSAKSLRFFHIIFKFPWLFGKNLNWSYLNIFNGMIIFNEMVI